MEQFPEEITIGDKYDPAMKIRDQAQADEYFQKCVEHTMRVGHHAKERAEEIVRQNLGYYAGYYGSETRARVECLFCCAHPIFGAIATKGQPTPEEAFETGRNLAAKEAP